MRNHDQATGSAIYYIIKNLAENNYFIELRKKYHLEKNMENQKVVMIGYGEMGRNAALFLWQKGVKVVGI